MNAPDSVHPEALRDAVTAALGDKAKSVALRLGEVTVTVAAANYLEACRILKDDAQCRFEQLIDLAGLDYSDYRDVNGLKMPFKWTTTWLDGRSNYEMSEIRPNVAIDAARFAKPAPPKPAK